MARFPLFLCLLGGCWLWACSDPIDESLCDAQGRCPPGKTCQDGYCVDRCPPEIGKCTAGAFRCQSGNREQCNSDGCGWTIVEACDCGCVGSACVSGLCKPGDFRCSGNTLQECAVDECVWETVQQCADHQACTRSGCKSCPEGYRPIRAGAFTMGSPEDEAGREYGESQHRVTLTNAFCMSETEVTQAQFQARLNYNPSSFPECGRTCPVETLNWHEAAAYCNRLSDLSRLERCYACSGSGPTITCRPVAGQSPYACEGYRLPTEAEWEYAARAGTDTAFYNGDIEHTSCSPADPNLSAIGWFCGNSAESPQPVARKEPNAWGLFDMAGNVWEWCHDWYGTRTTPITNPWSAPMGAVRVRGGSWSTDAKSCRSAYRGYNIVSYRSFTLGLRPVLTLH